MNVDDVKALATQIREEVAKAITGQHDTVDLMLTALFAGGHILLEGPPGTAKTMTARCFAQALGVAYGRIQFTPDLMPGDIVGSNIYNFQTGQFTLTRGPIFCDLLLADEINRTPPKTQAALLEAMQEHAVTFDGTTHALGPNFMVVATQNPIEHQGVYPLPEAQLDRFLFKHRVSYPEPRGGTGHHHPSWRRHRLARHQAVRHQGPGRPQDAGGGARDRRRGHAGRRCRRLHRERWCAATRESPDLEVGASPRAGAMLARAARARAALDGRAYVIPDDVKALAVPALRHRVILSPAAQIDGRLVEQIVSDLVDQTEAPR